MTYRQSSALAAIERRRSDGGQLKIVEVDSDLINNNAELQAHTQGHRSADSPGVVQKISGAPLPQQLPLEAEPILLSRLEESA